MLARTFLRLCALEALRPSALPDTTPADQWPTMAASFWFDSRLDPIDDITEEERRPVGVVYTEDDHQERISRSSPIFKSIVDLVFEISVAASGRDPNDEIVIGTPYTDAELEGSLDALENQVWHALLAGPSGVLFRKMAKEVHSFQSHPMRSAEEGVRLAARTIKAKVELKDVCYVAAPTAAPTGLDRLPPALRDIAAALDGSTYYGKLANAIAGGAPVMPLRVNFEGAGVTLDPAKPGAPPDPDAKRPIVADFKNLQG